MPVLYCIVYYVYDNPTYEVANTLICIVYLVSKSRLCLHRRITYSCIFKKQNIYAVQQLVHESDSEIPLISYHLIMANSSI